MRQAYPNIMNVAKYFMIVCLCMYTMTIAAQNWKSSTKPGPGTWLIPFPDEKENETATARSVLVLVDSISKAGGTGSHFAMIYSQVMSNIELQLKDADSSTAAFIRKFEYCFAQYFLNACRDAENGMLSAESPWRNLFDHPSLHPVRLTVMGINTHTNADIWQALVNNFTEKEIRSHKRQFLAFQASIAKVFFPYFDSVAVDSWYMRFMKSLTKGLVKNLGERIIYRWRVRAINLAIMYYYKPERFQKKLAVVNRKKEKVDQQLINRLLLILPKN